MFKEIILSTTLAVASSTLFAACESNVDSIQTLYINGMFTNEAAALSNKNAIDKFIASNLSGFQGNTEYVHNDSEWVLAQALEVLRQKVEDNESTDAIMEFINNDSGFLDSLTSTAQVEDFLRDIDDIYDFTASEEDAGAAIAKTREMLDTCSRVVLITHSQGNFYGNAVMSDIYSSYSFPHGYSISEYPMLGNMQIASPVNNPGGSVSLIYPQIIGHITNDNDLIMGLVRNTMGTVDSNYNSPDIQGDFTGHGLEVAYLNAPGQSAIIASELEQIANDLVPYPMQGQNSTSSSAINGFGHSKISSVLDIEFTDGSVYRYDGVGNGTANGLKSATSKGAYFNANIRSQYPYVQIY